MAAVESKTQADAKSSNLSLDDGKEDAKMFYYKVQNKLYAAPVNGLVLSKTLLNLHEFNKDAHTTQDDPVEINTFVMDNTHTTNEKVYRLATIVQINTVDQHDLINKYMTYWADNTTKADYVVKAPIKSANANAVLTNDFDYKLITEYKDCITASYTDDEKKHADKGQYYATYLLLSKFAPLMETVVGYMSMDGLGLKLAAYVATLLRNCSMTELTAASNDKMFVKMQQDAIDQWNKENPDKVEMLEKAKAAGRAADEFKNKLLAENKDLLDDAKCEELMQSMNLNQENANELKKKADALAAAALANMEAASAQAAITLPVEEKKANEEVNDENQTDGEEEEEEEEEDNDAEEDNEENNAEAAPTAEHDGKMNETE